MALLSSMFSSCQDLSTVNGSYIPNDSTFIPDSSVFRARILINNGFKDKENQIIELITVPFGYKMGDSIIIKGNTYVLKERVK